MIPYSSGGKSKIKEPLSGCQLSSHSTGGAFNFILTRAHFYRTRHSVTQKCFSSGVLACASSPQTQLGKGEGRLLPDVPLPNPVLYRAGIRNITHWQLPFLRPEAGKRTQPQLVERFAVQAWKPEFDLSSTHRGQKSQALWMFESQEWGSRGHRLHWVCCPDSLEESWSSSICERLCLKKIKPKATEEDIQC